MRKLFYFVVSLILVSSCKIKQSNIQDIWIGNSKITHYFDGESIENPIPYLIDLRNPDIAKIKYLPGQEVEKTWNISNNILTIGSEEYRLVSLSKDRLVYSPYMEELENPEEEEMNEDMVVEVPHRDIHYVFNRIKEAQIPISKDSLKQALSNKLWINEDVKGNKISNFADWVEFLDNGIVLIKMDANAGKLGESNIHIQSEGWEVDTYENYSFLVFVPKHTYSKGTQGFLNMAFQIIKLSNDKIEFDYLFEENQKVYDLYIPSDDVVQNNQLYGKWISKNDTSEKYSKFDSNARLREDEWKALFDDELTYELEQGKIKIIPGKFEPVTCDWRINSDGTIFILEHKVVDEYSNGYYVEFARFEMKSENTFELELFENYMMTGLENPRVILFNIFQTFEKVK